MAPFGLFRRRSVDPAPVGAEGWAERRAARKAAEAARRRERDTRRAEQWWAAGDEGITVLMPALGEDVPEGTVTRWLKRQGESIEVDEPLLEVSTDKVDTEIPSPVAGVIRRIVAEENETVKIGAALVIVTSGAPASEEAPTQP